MHPKYQAVVPLPDIARVPLAYPVAGRDREFADFLRQWINLKKSGLQFPQLYDHWILGRMPSPNIHAGPSFGMCCNGLTDKKGQNPGKRTICFCPCKCGVISVEDLNCRQFIEIHIDLNRSDIDFATEA
jgi:hypothetical protein